VENQKVRPVPTLIAFPAEEIGAEQQNRLPDEALHTEVSSATSASGEQLDEAMSWSDEATLHGEDESFDDKTIDSSAEGVNNTPLDQKLYLEVYIDFYEKDGFDGVKETHYHLTWSGREVVETLYRALGTPVARSVAGTV
jgi:hypothetical protein